ncbi:MAG: tetratricopeptide repeat protein [Bacteroidales bacterium]|nr:tetratricopeptide repeat protein [Bacteroidales bacterium]
MLLFYILFALLSQQTTDNGQQTLSTFVAPCTDTLNVSKHIICQQTTDNGQQIKSPSHQVSESPSKDDPNNSVTWRPVDSVTYYKYQIHLADSLYKNYLPQYNFDEVKEAVAFFERTTVKSQQTTDFVHKNKPQQLSNSASQNLSVSTSQNLSVSASQQLSNSASCARAHYYHAVGLTERNDIVGACEHYLRALEIMEIELETENLKTSKSEKSCSGTAYPRTVDCCPLSVDYPEDYEKLRFIALIYNRLGRLFLNENYCDLAIVKYRKALKYFEILDDNGSKANVLKELGNSYQLANKPDSALYYYNESLRYNSNQPNKLDVEKSIAQILYFNRNEKDSAYTILKNNLDKINNEDVKEPYQLTLGNMFYHDKVYDSALYYLETCTDNNIIERKLAFTTTLSAIYDSIGNYARRNYYNNISSRLFKDNVNKEVDNKHLQVLYDNYRERIKERERSIAKTKTRKLMVTTGLGILVIVVLIMIYIRYMHRKQNNKLKSEIDDYVNMIDNYSKDIENKNIIINQKEKLINDYQITNDKKDKIIDKQKKEIDRIRTRLSKKNVNIEAYYVSDICKKIVERKDSDFSCLKEDELALLLKSADEHLDNISERLHNSFPGLNKNDIYTICLLILNVEKGKLQYLLGKDRKTIWNRLNKIKRLMNVDENQDLFLYIKDNFLY